MRKSIAAAVIAASAATSACGHDRNEGAGPTVSRNYQVGNFHELEVAGPYDVQVRTGGNPGVSASGGERLLERTVVEVRGDKLVIRPEEQHGWFHFGWGSRGKATAVSLNARSTTMRRLSEGALQRLIDELDGVVQQLVLWR